MENPVSTAAKPLPFSANLEQYKKQSRGFLNDLHQNIPGSLARLTATVPHFTGVPKLSDAQLVIAREHGFASWPKFRQHIQALGLDVVSKSSSFIEAAITRRKFIEAKSLLANTPGLTGSSIYSAVTYGDFGTVRTLLDRNPNLVRTPGGPRGRVPLLYVCFSWFIAEREEEILDTVRLLLERGADPSAAYREEPYIDYPCSALYGACGILNHPTLATILIDAGANLNDNESLYHSVEHRNHACTRLLLDRGANPIGTNALKHQLDYDDIEGLSLLLDHGADPNEPDKTDNALHWALFRNRSAEHIAALIAHGADINTPSKDGLTPYRLALRHGNRAAAKLIDEAGGNTQTIETDAFLEAASFQDRDSIQKVLKDSPGILQALSPQELGMIADFAGESTASHITLLLDAGFPIDARGTLNATPLHWAAWSAKPETVKLLIERGAPIEATGADLGSTPLQWAIHASGNNDAVTQDAIIDVIEVFLEAGAHYDAEWSEMASTEVQDYIKSIPFPSS